MDLSELTHLRLLPFHHFSFTTFPFPLHSLNLLINPPSNNASFTPLPSPLRTSLSCLGPQLPTVSRILSLWPLCGLSRDSGILRSNYLRKKRKKKKKANLKQTGYCIHSDEPWKHLDNWLNIPSVSHLKFIPQPPFFLFFFFFYWRIIALQNFVVFCQTSTRISHRYTYIPSLLNFPPISLSIPAL